MGGKDAGQTRDRTRFLSSRLVRGVAVAVLAVAIGVPAAMASDSFPDVGSGHKFHDEIGAIKDAGITTGFSNGNYGPEVEISRGAMAAFQHRGFGRAGMITFTVTDTVVEPDSELVGAVIIDVPGVEEAFGDPVTSTQFVKVEYTTHFLVSNTASVICPCGVVVAMYDLLDFDGPLSLAGYEIADDEKEALHQISDSFVFKTAPTGVHLFVTEWLIFFTGGGDPLELAILTDIEGLPLHKMIATTFPFGADGGTELIGPVSEAEARRQLEEAERSGKTSRLEDRGDSLSRSSWGSR